jgi:high-affinity iron transporter
MPVASFLITLREALEAALILGVVAAYLRKVGHPEVSRYLYLGIASATVASICFAWVLQTIYSGLFDAYESLFEGTTALVASGFLTYMISWMAKNARSIKGELERKLELALSTGQLLGVAAIVFITVFREGLETVLLLTAIFFADPSGTTLGFMLGIVAVGALSPLITKSPFRLNLRSFFKYTSMILLLFAAGMISFA